MTLDARKGQNKSIIFYLKAKRYAPEGQEALANLTEQKKDISDKKEEWRKRLDLSSEMDINVVHRYSHLGEKLLRTTYKTLSVKLTGTLQVCGGCVRSKVKACMMRKKTYTRASQPREMIFVDTTSPFPENLKGNRYWIGDGVSSRRPSHNCQKIWKSF